MAGHDLPEKSAIGIQLNHWNKVEQSVFNCQYMDEPFDESCIQMYSGRIHSIWMYSDSLIQNFRILD